MTTIYSFSGSPDGATPAGALLADDQGVLYGTTFGGGNNGCFFGGCGTVFKLTPPGRGQTAWTEAVLWKFSGSDGGTPQAGLIADERGALYGTTSTDGACSSCGTVFKLTPPTHGQTGWTLSTLYAFAGGSDGASPTSTLIADRTGALFGTTNHTRASFPACCGVVFKLTQPASGQTPWTETVLLTFTGGSDGGNPVPGLIVDEKGALYGTTEFGGNLSAPNCIGFGCGVVFKLTGTGFVPKGEN